MGTNKQTQRKVKEHLDEILALSIPPRELLESLAVECASNPSLENTFQYAFALSKSDDSNELRYAVKILDGLTHEYDHQVDCMYGSAIACYLLGNYDDARSRSEAILRSKPDRRDIAELHIASIVALEDEEEARMRKAATIGAAAVGLAIPAIAIGIAGILLTRKK